MIMTQHITAEEAEAAKLNTEAQRRLEFFSRIRHEA